MRDRIVIGLMLANAAYSTANAVPVNLLRTGERTCGSVAMTFNVIKTGRAWWFFGKYGLAGFELLILGASIRALHKGVSCMHPMIEATLHAACWVLAGLAFTVFYFKCTEINNAGLVQLFTSLPPDVLRNHIFAFIVCRIIMNQRLRSRHR